jgi:hypothetical protein
MRYLIFMYQLGAEEASRRGEDATPLWIAASRWLIRHRECPSETGVVNRRSSHGWLIQRTET